MFGRGARIVFFHLVSNPVTVRHRHPALDNNVKVDVILESHLADETFLRAGDSPPPSLKHCGCCFSE
jgi:hypothetical protein